MVCTDNAYHFLYLNFHMDNVGEEKKIGDVVGCMRGQSGELYI